MPTVSPKVSMWINVVPALLMLAGSGTLVWPSYIPPGTVKAIAETCTWLGAVFTCVNVALHGYSAPKMGPLVPPVTADKVL